MRSRSGSGTWRCAVVFLVCRFSSPPCPRRQEAAEAVKKARREGEEQGRQEVEAEISKLKAEAEAKVEELSALLDTWKERVKTQDAKMDAEV